MASSIFSAVKADEMTGATSSSPGVSGLVPAPAAGDEDKVLKGDGSWGDALDGMLRIVPFSIGVSSWTLSNGVYTSNFVSEFITTTSVEFVEYTDSFRSSVRGDLSWTKTPGGGGITFRTGIAPSGTLEGEIRVFDRDDGKTAIVVQQTALPTMRNVPFTVAVADWSVNGSLYEAVFATVYVTATSHDFVEFDESIENATDGIKVEKAVSSGSVVGLKFTSRRVPAGAISGTVTPLDNADGKVAVVLQDTVMPIANGGTGANTLAGAKQNLGITELENAIAGINFGRMKFLCAVTATSSTTYTVEDTSEATAFGLIFKNTPSTGGMGMEMKIIFADTDMGHEVWCFYNSNYNIYGRFKRIDNTHIQAYVESRSGWSSGCFDVFMFY